MQKRNIQGLNKVVKKLSTLGKEAEKGLDQILDAVSGEVALNARQLAPKNFGQLSASIVNQKTKDLTYSVVVGAEYGAYIEFGTGTKVRVPAELQGVASKFRGAGAQGSFEQGLEAIKDWVRAKGIPEEAAYPIFISILKNGISPQPYLYPSFLKGREQAIRDAERLIIRLTK